MSDKQLRILNYTNENNIPAYLKNINPEYSNIDDVYNYNLEIWYNNNIERNNTKKSQAVKSPIDLNFLKDKNGFDLSEVDFIDSESKNIELYSKNVTVIEKEQLKYYDNYLSKKRSKVNWIVNDYYDHYIKTGRFGFIGFLEYKSEDFISFANQLELYKTQYEYIFYKLSNIEKVKFKNDFSDQLIYLKNRQTQSKFIEVIEDLSEYIHDSYLTSKKGLRIKTTQNFNANHWNEDAYNLFEYLEANYDKKGKTKYTNIYYFFKDIIDKDKYSFMPTQEAYAEFILKKYKLEIKKYKKAQYRFTEKEVPILKNLEQEFRENY
jgi:hypothetical protein